ncbi:MAG: hypothetical protein ACYC0M_03300 [Burkholderiales bacterium]
MFEQNEIRDYIARSPRRFRFDGKRMINKTGVRFTWLAPIASDTIDERISRRAGFIDLYKPFKFPVGSSQRRHQPRQLVKRYGRGGAWLMMYV